MTFPLIEIAKGLVAAKIGLGFNQPSVAVGLTFPTKFMKTLRIVASASVLVSLVVPSRAEEPAPSPTQYATLQPWIGGVWSTPIPANKKGITGHIDTRYSWSENREGVLVNASTVKSDGGGLTVTGILVWNPAKKIFLILEGTSDGTVEEGTVTREGNDLAFEITITKKDGTISKGRSRFKMLGPDVMQLQVFLFKNGDWVKIADQPAERHKANQLAEPQNP